MRIRWTSIPFFDASFITYTIYGVRFVRINDIWDRISKILILIVDAGLNYYFLRTVKERLVKQHGLRKYAPLVTFNARLMVVSILMDVRLRPWPYLHMDSTANNSMVGYAYRTHVTAESRCLHSIPPCYLHGQIEH